MTHAKLRTAAPDWKALLAGDADLMREIVRAAVTEILEVEMTEAVGAERGERTEGRLGYRAGYYPRNLVTRVGKLELRVPRDREGRFSTQLFERYSRSEKALVGALAEMYVQGVSTRKVTAVVEQLCGSSVSSSQVSRAAALLDEKLEGWRHRPLGEICYLYLDARYERVRQDGQVRDAAVLIAIGVDPSGHRQVLGVSVALSEQEVHWRSFLQSLVKRGLRGLRLIISDDHGGLKAARQAVFGAVPWQRCQYHLQQNAQAYVPRKELQAEVAADIRTIFNAPERTTANEYLTRIVQKYAKSASKLADWLEKNIPEGLTVFAFPATHQRRLRTSNSLERVNRELDRRTAVVGIFPNEASCLRLVSAVLIELDEAWQDERVYLAFDVRQPSQQ